MSKTKTTLRSDGEATRLRILTVASEIIAAQGFANTKSKDIAIKAEVDVASINYHFKSRDNLYKSVLINAHRQIIHLEDLQQIVLQTKHPDDKFRDFINYLFRNSMVDNFWAPKILAREILSPSAAITSLINEEILPKLQVIKTLLSEVSGIAVDSPKLYPCLMSVMAPCLMYLANLPMIQKTLAGDHKDDVNTISEFFVTFSLSGLKSIAKSNS
jgi:TetR/AcrR family transcriptional regulator, regulator of cefoperazone and chloramphenicol sensitivity